MSIFVTEPFLSAGCFRISQGGQGGIELLGKGIAVDADLTRCCTLIAIVLDEYCLKVGPLELPLGHVERDAFPDHFHDEVLQQLAHHGVTGHVSIVGGAQTDRNF